MKSKGHVEIPGASLVPENDPSLLFVGAGMVPLVPFLMGEKHPAGNRLTSVQRSIRTVDIDEVGDVHHCTAFEMLGNWSLNDYFKEEAINLTVEFYIEILGLDIKNIYVSVFSGDKDTPKDEESVRVWKDIFARYGIEARTGTHERIQPFGKKENWWGLNAGGPCGPDSEFFYDSGRPACGSGCNVSCQCGKYIELGNNVFMEYNKTNDGIKPLGRHNVDFGGGMERIAMMFQETESYFETDMYLPILNTVKSLSKEANLRSERIIVDHIKSATWIIMDGVTPGRSEQGYILRRLIRRAVRHGRILKIDGLFSTKVAEVVIDQYKTLYPQILTQKKEILDVLRTEEDQFQATIQKGLKRFGDLFERQGSISGEDAFYLFETYGFPVEITQEMAKEKGFNLKIEDFQKADAAHKEKSRSAATGFFKGGLADTSDMSKRYHTATHLLNAALRKVLGNHVYQKGSNISPERIRFDFPNDEKLTPEQVTQVEDIVNEQISKGLDVYFEEMPKDEALKIVPTAVFADKYGETVKVYSVGRGKDLFSREICGGPHVENTSELGTFRIIKQENVGAGVKRIKAVLS